MTDVISKATTAAVAGDQWTVHHDRADSTLEARVAILGPGSTESAAPSALSVPPIFSLSNELLIKIISNLYYPNDIYTCRQTCRKLNNLIINSELIQYILRTALSSMFDPLYPGLSLLERLEALERLETAWAEMDLREPNRRIETPIPTGPDCPSDFSFRRQYCIVFREGYAQPARYSFLDMRSIFSSHADTALWKTIEVDIPNVLVFAFAPSLDLIVAISCVTQLLAHLRYTPSASRLICDLLNPCRLGHPTFRTSRNQL
jgi:hypothetical protein